MAARSQATGSPSSYRAVAGLALSLFIPSAAIVQRYWGHVGVAGYLLVFSVVLLLFVRGRHTLARLASRVSDRQALWLAALTFLIVLIALVLIYPIADSGSVGGGSDSDDALYRATSELLRGRYPYYAQTYLGNLPAQLPGALLLAIPFVLLGNSAYQNLFWLIVFFIAMKWYFEGSKLALLLVWAIFALSPIVLYQVVVGSDHIANSLYVLLAVLWMTWAISQPDLQSRKGIVPAIFLGVALSSRANFLLLLPLLVSAMVKIAGWKSAVKYAAITGATFLVITVPFYLYDPQAFSPLHAAGKLGRFDSVLPFAGLGILVATLIVALILAFLQPASRNPGILLGNCALVLAFPVACGIVLSSVMSATPSFWFASYGVFYLFFGVVASWSGLFENTELAVPVLAPAIHSLESRDRRVDGQSPLTRDGMPI